METGKLVSIGLLYINITNEKFIANASGNLWALHHFQTNLITCLLGIINFIPLLFYVNYIQIIHLIFIEDFYHRYQIAWYMRFFAYLNECDADADYLKFSKEFNNLFTAVIYLKH